MSEDLAEFVQEYLDKRDISQRELARRARLAHHTIRRIVLGEDPSETTLTKLARAVGIAPDYLFVLAGYLPAAGYPNLDPEIKALCIHIEEMPPLMKRSAINIFWSIVREMEEIIAQTPQAIPPQEPEDEP